MPGIPARFQLLFNLYRGVGEIVFGEQVTDVVVYVDEAHDITGHVVRKDDESVPAAFVKKLYNAVVRDGDW